MRTAHTYACLTLVVLAGLMLTGCGDDGQERETSTAASSSSETAHPTEPTSTTDPEAEPDDDADDELNTSSVSGKECLPGNWHMDTEKFAELLSDAAGSEVRAGDGGVTMFIQEDGATTVEYRDWSYSFRQDGVTLTLTRSGTDESVYEATSDDTLTARDIAMNSVATLESPAGTLAYDSSEDRLSFAEAHYVCEGDTLTITTEDGAVFFGREH